MTLVGFQVPFDGNITEDELVDWMLPDLVRSDRNLAFVGQLTIVGSTAGEAVEADVRISREPYSFWTKPFLAMPRPWLQLAVNVWDLVGVGPPDYVDLAVDMLRKLLTDCRFPSGIFALKHEDPVPFLSWDSEGTVVHQYESDGGGASVWNGSGYRHDDLASLALPLLDELELDFTLQRQPLTDLF